MKFNPLDEEIKETLADLEGALCGCKYYVENQFHKFKEQFCKNYNKQLSLLCFNINGLPKKKDELEIFLETLEFDFDILGITETHLNGVSEKLATLKDYNFVTNSRKCKKWGQT